MADTVLYILAAPKHMQIHDVLIRWLIIAFTPKPIETYKSNYEDDFILRPTQQRS